MESIKPCSIIQFNDNQMQDVRKTFGYDDLNNLNQDLDQFEDWILKQNHFEVKKFDREFLERFLIYNKGSVERAKQRLDKICTFNNLMPEFLQEFDVKNEFNPLLNAINNCILPKPTPQHYRVIAVNFTGIDDEWTLVQYYRYLVLTCEYMMYNDYCYGYEMLCDISKSPLSMVTKLNPITIRKAFILILEAFGQRLRKIHMVAGSKIFETTLSIMKQGLTAKLISRLTIHSNMQALHEHLPKEMLPKDFGGEEKSMKELTSMDFKEFCTDEHIKRVKFLEGAKTNEDLRLKCKFNEEYSGMPGSFKTLSID